MQEQPVLATHVPFLDLAPIHAPLKETLIAAFAELVDSGAFTNGPAVEELESAFAGYCGVEHCVGVSSGLDALRLGLLASGIEPGDEVVVPAHTFVATLEAVTQAGGQPVLVDISAEDYSIDAQAVSGTSAPFVMPVHLYGQIADLAALERLGRTIVEDACQAHGAVRDGRRAGSSGHIAAFSFYPGKNLGAMGDAGALVTENPDVVERVRALREHGQTAKYRHDVEGWTARLDTLQALVLLHKLPFLDGWNEERRAAARVYNEELTGVGDLHLPPVPRGSEPVWHLYVVRTGDPEALAQFLRTRGIGTGRHYPDPVHLTDAYRWLGYARGDFPVAEALAQEALSLPMFPGITEDQLNAVTTAAREFFAA